MQINLLYSQYSIGTTLIYSSTVNYIISFYHTMSTHYLLSCKAIIAGCMKLVLCNVILTFKTDISTHSIDLQFEIDNVSL